MCEVHSDTPTHALTRKKKSTTHTPIRQLPPIPPSRTLLRRRRLTSSSSRCLYIIMIFTVRAFASQLVKPTVPPPYPFSTLPSCKLDLVIANIYVNTVYFFKRVDSPSDFFNTDVLTQSLSQALSRFYPFAGRISADIDIQCNGNGALFVEALADCTIRDLGELTPDPELLKLVPTLDESQDITSHPLLLIQVTYFECGGVALGVALEHHVGDGVSALSFLKTWCSLARGETIKIAPSFDKAWLRARTPPTPQFVHDEYLKLPQPISKKHQSPCADGDHELLVRMFDLPKEFLHRLKVAGAGALSTYELLAAHVWRCCCKARMLSNEVESMLVMAIDGRTRLSGMSNPQNYVGNVIFNCCPSLSVGEILCSSVPMLAGKIRSAIRKMDNEYCKSAIDFLELRSREELKSYVKGPHTFASPNLGFISWTKFPFYDIDFGWGSATHVGPVHVPWEGHAYVLAAPSATHEGSLRLCINLKRLHMKKFSQLLLLDSP